MEEQTKIGTGAAAVIALMSILEPHLFESHPVFAALIYVGLGSVALWGFIPIAVRLTRMFLKGGFRRMWPQYLMAFSGFLFFVGFVAFLQLNVSPPEPKKELPFGPDIPLAQSAHTPTVLPIISVEQSISYDASDPSWQRRRTNTKIDQKSFKSVLPTPSCGDSVKYMGD